MAEEKIREAATKDMVRVKRVSSKVKTWYLQPQRVFPTNVGTSTNDLIITFHAHRIGARNQTS